MPDRLPLGDDLVSVGSDAVVANAGAVVYGGPPHGGVGVLSSGAASWGTTGGSFPASPSVESLQVSPIDYEPNYSAAFPANDPDRWKGTIGVRPRVVTGFEPR